MVNLPIGKADSVRLSLKNVSKKTVLNKKDAMLSIMVCYSGKSLHTEAEVN